MNALMVSKMISRSYTNGLVLSCSERYTNVGIDSEIRDSVPERYTKYFSNCIEGLSATKQWCLKEAFFKASNSDRSIRFIDIKINRSGRLVNIYHKKKDTLAFAKKLIFLLIKMSMKWQ
jgi:phosphopantetheinyl transferase (holo-ACP synthase)